METFKINDEYTVVCEFKSTRTGFKHTAKLYKNGDEVDHTKILYLNRTWECFTYQSVLYKILDKNHIKTELDDSGRPVF